MGRRAARSCIALTTVLALAQCSAADSFDNDPGFTSTSRTFTGFKTEPTFNPEIFNIQRTPVDDTRLAPGYLFLDPIYSAGAGWGPQIYTADGELVWQGPQEHRTQNLHVCDYLGETGTHLCYSRAHEVRRKLPQNLNPSGRVPSHEYGWNVILDHTYSPVEPNITRAVSEDLPLEKHAFEILPGGQLALNLYIRPEPMDLTAYGGTEDGWVINQCFEEVDLKSRKSNFNWCWLQSGLKVWETQLFFNNSEAWTSEHGENKTARNVGKGKLEHEWDFLHCNALDKNSQGDYYVSVRHADQILKIAGPESTSGAESGTVLWRLGGKGNSFDFKDFPLPSDVPPFARPHDVRSISTSGTEEVISLLNNAWEGTLTPSQDYSDGQFIQIDTEKMTATLQRNYKHPRGKVSPGRGSVQTLPNGNILIGWGKVAEFTEFAEDGTVLAHVHFAARVPPPIGKKHKDKNDREFAYRVLKSPWVGKPWWDPKLVVRPARRAHRARIHDGNSGVQLDAYVSWNGATEVASWRFSFSNDEQDDVGYDFSAPWISAGTFDRTGFETTARLRTTSRCPPAQVKVEALDANGRMLGSATADTAASGILCGGNLWFSSVLAFLAVLVTVEAFVYAVHFVWYYVICWESQGNDYWHLEDDKHALRGGVTLREHLA